jgi:hypothetical protein
MDSRVGRLRLNIRGAAGQEGDLPRYAEQFSRNVLERFCQLVEDRFPGRDVVIRRMDLRCSLSPEQLIDTAEAKRYAAALAATIVVPEEVAEPAAGSRAADAADGTSRAETSRSLSSGPGIITPPGKMWQPRNADETFTPLARANTAGERGHTETQEEWNETEPVDPLTANAFNDAVELILFCLGAEARGGGDGWVEAWLSAAGGESHEVSDMRRRAIIGALSQLDAVGTMIETLAALSPRTIAALLDGLDVGTLIREMVQRWRLDSSHEPNRDASDPVTRASAGNGEFDRRLMELARRLPPTMSPDAAAVALHVRALALPAADKPSAFSRSPVPPGAPHSPIRHGTRPPEDQPIAELPLVPGTELQTRYGGLFYLLSLVLELGIGEALWKVCLPEGLVLACAAAAILGHDAADDAAPLLFGGVTTAEALELFTISPEQQEEVCVEIMAATVSALPRFDIGSLPVPLLDIIEGSAGRLLVATCGFPVAIFAWPAPDAVTVAAGIETFLRVWPSTAAAPQARDVLLGLNTSDRLRPAVDNASMASCLLPEAPTAGAGSVLAQVCGSVLQLFHSRLAMHDGEVVSNSADLVSRYLALPGRIIFAPEVMTIVMPMDRIDMAVRRAALDRDPGWVPWLQQTVRIEFEPQSPEEVL